ncbi:MAG TPA: hypothetical protein VEZ40_11715 [Pyrinomonadaceae bacterium]|nr:hypothetical protein [Pyrinomonadaceae bacterium]
MDDREEARRRLAEILEARVEWFCAETREGAGVPLGRGEWELMLRHGALYFSYRNERGRARVWRVAGWAWTGERLRLDATRRMGAECARLELVPRASVREGLETLKAARRAACERLAALVCEATGNARVERASLSAGARRSEPGRYARITLRAGRERVAATGALVALGAHEAEAYLASALLWWRREGAKSNRRAGARRLWLVVSPDLKDAIAGRLALLSEDVRREIELFETDEGRRSLARVAPLSLAQTLAAAPRFRRPPRAELSETAARIVALAPEAIDAVRASHGETLRFHGLSFARVRSWMRHERVWFGVGRAPRVLLADDNRPQFSKLLDELREHRRAAVVEHRHAPVVEHPRAVAVEPRRNAAIDHRHAFYASAPEAWLESLLRRDITRLDPGLRLAPLYAQFRTPAHDGGAGARPVDLLALRRDGRLVVIELKVSEDAALPLQGAHYWQRVEAHRRRGDLVRSRLFGDAHIADEPPLVYLVAPFLRFHRHFDTLARLISPAVEMYRVDLNEDWRAGVRVLRRAGVRRDLEGDFSHG